MCNSLIFWQIRSFKYVQHTGIAGSFNSSECTFLRFPQWLLNFTFSTVKKICSSFYTSLTLFVVICFLKGRYPDIWGYWILFQILDGHLYFLFISVACLSTWMTWNVSFCIWFFHFFICTLDINPQYDAQLPKIITHLVGCLFTLVKLSFAVSNNIFLMVNCSIKYKLYQ